MKLFQITEGNNSFDWEQKFDFGEETQRIKIVHNVEQVKFTTTASDESTTRSEDEESFARGVNEIIFSKLENQYAKHLQYENEL